MKANKILLPDGSIIFNLVHRGRPNVKTVEIIAKIVLDRKSENKNLFWWIYRFSSDEPIAVIYKYFVGLEKLNFQEGIKQHHCFKNHVY